MTYAQCEIDELAREADTLRQQLESYRRLAWGEFSANLASIADKATRLDRILWQISTAQVEEFAPK